MPGLRQVSVWRIGRYDSERCSVVHFPHPGCCRFHMILGCCYIVFVIDTLCGWCGHVFFAHRSRGGPGGLYLVIPKFIGGPTGVGSAER